MKNFLLIFSFIFSQISAFDFGLFNCQQNACLSQYTNDDISTLSKCSIQAKEHDYLLNSIASLANDNLKNLVNKSKKVWHQSGVGTSPAPKSSRYNWYTYYKELGGVVIYLTRDNQHGLVAAIEDAGINIQWSALYPVTVETSNETAFPKYKQPYKEQFAGYQNQQNIQKEPDWRDDYPSFQIAADYRGGGFEDWFLPSGSELELMCTLSSIINVVFQKSGGQPLQDSYWSSSLSTSTAAIAFENVPDTSTWMQVSSEIDNLSNIRCVRVF